MTLFPWRYGKNSFGTNAQYPYINAQYGGKGGYTEAFNEMIKRNIEAEQKNANYTYANEILPENKKEISEKLKEFIKNEKNSFLFYEYLRGICGNRKFRGILKKISEDCETAENMYARFYRENFDNDILIGKSSVNENVNFFDGILWALEVESESIFNILEFIDVFNIKEEKLKNILFGKSARVGCLNYIAVSKRE